MSEADVIRGHIISDAEAIDGEWGCVHEWADMTPKCAGYADAVAALAALDSLTTRLHDEQVAHGYTKSEALAHFTRQKDAERRLAEVTRERDEARKGWQLPVTSPMSDPAAAAMKAAYAKVWTRANPFPSAQAVAESEAFLSSLDSLTTRLAAVERENDLVRHENYDLREQLTQAERERDELAQRIVEADEQDALREQLTQAREALEESRALLVGVEGKAMSAEALYPVLSALYTITAQALATINEGNET